MYGLRVCCLFKFRLSKFVLSFSFACFHHSIYYCFVKFVKKVCPFICKKVLHVFCLFSKYICCIRIKDSFKIFKI